MKFVGPCPPGAIEFAHAFGFVGRPFGSYPAITQQFVTPVLARGPFAWMFTVRTTINYSECPQPGGSPAGWMYYQSQTTAEQSVWFIRAGDEVLRLGFDGRYNWTPVLQTGLSLHLNEPASSWVPTTTYADIRRFEDADPGPCWTPNATLRLWLSDEEPFTFDVDPEWEFLIAPTTGDIQNQGQPNPPGPPPTSYEITFGIDGCGCGSLKAKIEIEQAGTDNPPDSSEKGRFPFAVVVSGQTSDLAP